MKPNDIRIQRKYRGKRFVISCAFCEGKAHFPETALGDTVREANFPCPVCKGKGSLIIVGSLKDILDCKMCRSTGKAWDEDGYFMGATCEVCNGLGVNVVDEEFYLHDFTERNFWSLIDDRIKRVAQERYASKFYSDAVESAFKEICFLLKKKVKQVSGKELDGTKLGEFAFSLEKPILTVADLSTESGRNIQNGFMRIFCGSILAIRNPKAHEVIEITTDEAINLLFVANYVIKKIDEAKPVEMVKSTISTGGKKVEA